jgi:hypothetical protein
VSRTTPSDPILLTNIYLIPIRVHIRTFVHARIVLRYEDFPEPDSGVWGRMTRKAKI